MMRLKSYIYLDEQKMYSLSSQLFEGITQYIMREEADTVEEEHSQRGEILSGRLMADMIMQKNAKSEMKYLHDFAFNLFEQELVKREMLFDVTEQTTIEDLRDKGFVRFKGKVVFEDYDRMIYTLEHLNELGRALGEISLPEFKEVLEEIKANNQRNKNKEQKNKANQLIKNANKVFEDELKKKGFIVDENYKDNLVKLLEYGYRNKYEIHFCLNGSEVLYTAVINQENLKETEQSIISKYSRLSEKEFTIIGVVTQSGNVKASAPSIEGNGMKDAIVNVIDKMAMLEDQFCGRVDKECIIDPIAIYSEI